MNTIYSLVPCAVLGLAGWFLYRNPAPILDFVFGKDEMQYRRFAIRFFRAFGVVVMSLASLSAVITVVFGLLKALA